LAAGANSVTINRNTQRFPSKGKNQASE